MLGNAIGRMTIFQDLTSQQIGLLGNIFVLSYEPTGTTLFEQGEETDYLFLVVEGEVNLRYKPEDGPVITLARVRPEGVVGWSAALGNPTYTSSAVCASDCELLRVRGEDLRQLCDGHPETGTLVLDRLATMIAERMRLTHNQVIALLEQGLQIDENKPVGAV
jgi:CRP-like cAMP-binding protein